MGIVKTTAAPQSPKRNKTPARLRKVKGKRRRARESVFLLLLLRAYPISSRLLIAFLIMAEQSNWTLQLLQLCRSFKMCTATCTNEPAMRQHNEAVVFNCLKRHMKECFLGRADSVRHKSYIRGKA